MTLDTAVVLHIFDVLLLLSFYVYACREAHVNWYMMTCQGSTRSELP